VSDRDPASGRLFETGSGAKSQAEQSARFAAEAARASDMPLSGESAPNGRRYETGRGCLTKTAQREMWARESNPEIAKIADAHATAVEAAAEVKDLAAAEEFALASMVIPFPADTTRH
jgi:hypothetical protein